MKTSDTSDTTVHFSTFDTPLGEFSVAVNDAGALVATAFGDRSKLATRLADGTDLANDDARCAAAREEVRAYFAGTNRAFTLPLAPRGTPFQQRVWAALQKIKLGQTRSYGELARELCSSARAVGRANATNPICLVVPCHRVIGADGSLTGFAFGEEIKRKLLEREGALRIHLAGSSSG